MSSGKYKLKLLVAMQEFHGLLRELHQYRAAELDPMIDAETFAFGEEKLRLKKTINQLEDMGEIESVLLVAQIKKVQNLLEEELRIAEGG